MSKASWIRFEFTLSLGVLSITRPRELGQSNCLIVLLSRMSSAIGRKRLLREKRVWSTVGIESIAEEIGSRWRNELWDLHCRRRDLMVELGSTGRTGPIQ